MKNYYFLAFVIVLCGCGESNSFDHNVNAPYATSLQANGHSVNDIIKFNHSDDLWLIVGLSADLGTLGFNQTDVIIYDNPNDFAEPEQGIKGQYYVFVSNSADSFYIDVIPRQKALFQGETDLTLTPAANIVVLDNSIWQVKGVDVSQYLFNYTIKYPYTLYEIDSKFPKDVMK